MKQHIILEHESIDGTVEYCKICNAWESPEEIRGLRSPCPGKPFYSSFFSLGPEAIWYADCYEKDEKFPVHSYGPLIFEGAQIVVQNVLLNTHSGIASVSIRTWTEGQKLISKHLGYLNYA